MSAEEDPKQNLRFPKVFNYVLTSLSGSFIVPTSLLLAMFARPFFLSSFKRL